jgi:diguanylate cyclase (GGDEF)-like protein
MTGLALGSGALVFALEFAGYTHSRVGDLTGWPALVDFLLITGVIGALGRYSAEMLVGGDASRDSGIDPVTGLVGRARFLALAGSRLRRADPARETGVLVLADLTGFRRMNVVVGHEAADRILLEVARRIAALHGSALCGRVGDDEFALLAFGLPDAAAAEALARRMFEALAFEHAGVSVRAGVGYAPVPMEAHDIEPLFLAADAALTAAAAQLQVRFAGPAAPR